jgi:hypothetical protein
MAKSLMDAMNQALGPSLSRNVRADVEETDMAGDYGPVAGLLVTCSRCGHQVEVFGTSEASARRGAVMLAEECPGRKRNFYEVDWREY